MSTTTHLLTAEELIKLEGPFRYQLVKGELLTMSPAGEEHGAVSMKLGALLWNHVIANNLGVIYGAETGFQLERDPDTVLAPDVAFIARERVGSLSNGYRFGPPDLAVEVLSPGDRKSKVARKTAQWLTFGVRAVWLVDLEQRTVEVVSSSGERKLFHESDELVDDTIPGFSVKVSEIFG